MNRSVVAVKRYVGSPDSLKEVFLFVMALEA